MFRAAAIGVAAILAAAGASAEVAPGEIVWGEYGEIEQPLTDTPGDPESGRVVMGTSALGNCVACHSIEPMQDEAPFHGNIGPELMGAPDRWSEADLRGIIVDAKQLFPDSFMPGMYKVGPFIRPGVEYTGVAPETPEDMKPILTAQQVEDVVAYLMTLTE